MAAAGSNPCHISINHVGGVLALLDPPLQPYNLTPYLSRLIIHMQQPDTTSRLPAPISSAAWIKQQKPGVFLIPGNMAMPKNNTLGIGKLLPRDSFTIV
jgi:hypothetical protein